MDHVLRERLQIVLHQIRSPDNLGAVARLCANFGFAAPLLSDPMTWDLKAADRLAVKSEHILERLKLHRGLDEALAESVFTVGTTSRAVVGRPGVLPEDAMALLARHAERGRVALLFGGEQRGLSDEDLGRCDEVLVIPTQSAQPSMNLAQSASLLLYLASREGRAKPADAPVEEGAPHQAMAALESRMEEVLLRAGYLNPQAPQHIRNELFRSLRRAHLSKREVELWLGAFAHLRRTVKPG